MISSSLASSTMYLVYISHIFISVLYLSVTLQNHLFHIVTELLFCFLVSSFLILFCIFYQSFIFLIFFLFTCVFICPLSMAYVYNTTDMIVCTCISDLFHFPYEFLSCSKFFFLFLYPLILIIPHFKTYCILR